MCGIKQWHSNSQFVVPFLLFSNQQFVSRHVRKGNIYFRTSEVKYKNKLYTVDSRYLEVEGTL